MPSPRRERSSFRDRRGFVFWEGGKAFRQINESGREAYEQMMESGLYKDLVNDGLLVPHVEVSGHTTTEPAYKVILPQQVSFVSYPYEWSFSQLKDAALVTLHAQKLALKHGMTLRDASAYNVQFMDGRAVIIDTLSFGRYEEGEPWVAYRQFCQHFLAPLVLMAKVDPALLQLERVYIDGVPLALAAKLLPLGARMSFGTATHITLHARFQRQHQGRARRPQASVSKISLEGLVASLESTVRAQKLGKLKTEWDDYYARNNNYTDSSMEEKAQVVKDFLRETKPQRVVDLGANDGRFSRAAAELGAYVVSADIDPLAVDANWRQVLRAKEKQIVPVLLDLTNPSPGLGWADQERMSFSDRTRADAVLALALIHHLAIANNLPLEMVAEYFATLAPWLVIEFVPKSDSQVKKLLATREDIFDDYTPKGFEKAFSKHYRIAEKRKLRDAERILYLMERTRG